MPAARDTKPAPAHAEANLIEALSKLAAKGSYAKPMNAGHGCNAAFGVFSMRNDYAEAVVTLDGSVIALACRRGWLARQADGERICIAPEGIAALRRARSAGSATVAATRAIPKSKSKAAMAALASCRLLQTSPLAWLRGRKDKDGQPLITEAQFAAGERLASDFWHAQLRPRMTVNWSGTALGRHTRRAAPGTGVEISDHVIAARTRVHRALSAVGPELGAILVDVCCHDVGLEAAERAQRLPHRSGKVVLQMALTSLARHYGLLPPQPPPDPFGRLRHWGSDDYRPTLDAWRS
jgi:hypothetical protein